MKLNSLILTIFAVFCVSSSFAQNRDKPNRPKGPQVAPAPDRPSREEMLKKFDKDGDGKLNKAEQAALREGLAKLRGQGGRGPGRGDRKPPVQILEKFDKDGDGELNEEERGAMREEFAKRRAEAMKKFDKDGDGKLNEEERAALRKAMSQRPRPGGRPDGKPGARPDGGGRPDGKKGGRPPREGGRPGGKPAPKDG